MYLIIAETANFTFHTIAQSEEGGYRALLKAWRTHCNQTGAQRRYMKELIEEGGVNAYPIAMGQVLRDGERIE